MKTRIAIRYAVLAVCSVVVPLLLSVPMAFCEPYLLYDDPTGGDCMLIGTWDAPARTCLLNANVYAPVEIMSSGITLDGNGYALLGVGDGYGVTIAGLADVTVRNLVVDFYGYGMKLTQATGALIEHNTVSWAVWGIWLNDRTNNSMVVSNLLLNDGIGFMVSWGAHDNVIESNVIEGSTTGINLGYAYGNEVVNNEFSETYIPATSRGYTNPVLANYWADYDEPGEGCVDADADGFCDAPFVFLGGMDAQPGVTGEVDTVPPMIAVEAVPAVLPEDNKLHDVLITGSTDDSKSGTASVTITVTDEYNEYNQAVPGFGSTVTLRAHCKEKDLDGRHYTITVVATDMYGNESTAAATVLVPNPKSAPKVMGGLMRK